MGKTVTREQVAGAVMVVHAIAEAIRALGKVPAGYLYARVMCSMSFPMSHQQFQDCIDVLKRAGLVSERGHLLKWVGPEIAEVR